jgi:hypothetical protein
VAPLAVAAALLTLAGARARWAALAAMALALAILGTGSEWFADRFASDPLLSRSAEPAWRAGAARALRQARLEWRARDLRLAPAGLAFAVRQTPDDDDRPGPFHVGRFEGDVRAIDAVDLRFLADGRLLVLTGSGAGAGLRVVAPDGAPPDPWRREWPGLVARDLLVDPASGDWRVAAYDARGPAFVIVAGTVGRDDVVERRWTIPAAEHPEDLDYLAGRRFLLEPRYTRRPPPAPMGWLLDRLGIRDRGDPQWELWRLGAAGDHRLLASAIPVHCTAPRLPVEVLTCIVYDRGVRTLVWSLDAEGGALSVLGALPGDAGAIALGPDGRVAAKTPQGGVLLESATKSAVRFPLPGEPGRVAGLALEAGGLGVLARHGSHSTVTVYEVR